MQIDELRRALNGYKAWLGIFGELQLASPGVACEGRSCGTRTQLLGLKASAALLCTYHTSQWCVDSYKASDLETCRPLSAECIEFVRSPTSCLLAVACCGTCTGVHVQRSTRWRLFKRCAAVLSSSSVLAVDALAPETLSFHELLRPYGPSIEVERHWLESYKGQCEAVGGAFNAMFTPCSCRLCVFDPSLHRKGMFIGTGHWLLTGCSGCSSLYLLRASSAFSSVKRLHDLAS